MGIFESSEQRIQNFYRRAWVEGGGRSVDPHRNPALDYELRKYAKDKNCSYQEAFLRAKTGGEK